MLSYISPTSTPPPPSPSLTSHSLMPAHLQPANSHPRFSPRASPNVSPGSSPRLRAVSDKAVAAAGTGFAKFDGSEGTHSKTRRPIGMNRLASIAAIPSSSSGGAGLSNSIPYGFNFGTGFGFSPDNGVGGMDRKDSLDTMFDYESEGLIFPAKRMDGLEPALRELVEILMGDVESSGSEGESDGEDDGLHHEMEMEPHPSDGKKHKRHSFASSVGAPEKEREREPEPGIGIRSGRRKSRMMEVKMRPAAKGWRKGVAKESVKIQLMVDLPCWEPGCYNDLSSMHALRDKTLQALHVVVDALTIRGIRTTYRLHSTANGGAWGCIRVAPVLGSKLPLQRGQIDGQSSTFKDKENSETTSSSITAATPASLLSIRRSTVANPGNKGVNPLSTSWNEKATGVKSVEDAKKEREREMDEKERVAKRVKKALEQDGQGIVEEYRSYLLAINGQPALVLT